MSRRFRTNVFCITREDDKAEFEAIKQAALIDDDGRYEILSEEGYWTRDGDRMVSLAWIENENPDEQEERY